MKIKGEFVLREIAGDAILVPIGKTALERNGMITLSPTAAVIWKGLEEGTAEDAILGQILDRFDIDEDTAKSDMAEFMDQLRAADLVEE